jgi:hypothetical protein
VSRHGLPFRRTEGHARTLRPWLPFRVLTCRPGRVSDLLSWDSSDKPSFACLTACTVSWTVQTLRSTWPGEVGCRDSPPPACLPSVHSPESTLLPTRFGPEAACLGIVFRPRGFAPPRRLPPLGRLRACCIPLPVMGFAAFPAIGFRVDPATWTSQAPSRRSTEAFPATLFTPLEEFPPTAAAPRHRGRCPLAVPSRLARLLRSPPLPESTLGDPLDGSVGFEALLRRRVRDAIRPLPAGGRPILPGLRSPSRSFPEAREPPRSLTLALHRPCNSKSPRRAGAPFRTHSACALRATPAASLRRAIGWDDCIGRRPKTLAVATWHQTSKKSRRTSPTGKHRRGRNRLMSRIEALRRPKTIQGRGSMRTESLRRFTESRERVSCSPGPDRSQDPGRRW